eukprot:GHVU01119850.1.p1 GENE.GHVU01119850.1~~GHVU01119850.1.p1  ORF type:complete len:233 (+),score=27.39 GHVU01119850.1:129-827(+)
MCVSAHVSACVHADVRVCVRVCARMCACVRVCTYVRVCVRAYVCACVCVRARLCVSISVCVCLCGGVFQAGVCSSRSAASAAPPPSSAGPLCLAGTSNTLWVGDSGGGIFTIEASALGERSGGRKNEKEEKDEEKDEKKEEEKEEEKQRSIYTQPSLLFCFTSLVRLFVCLFIIMHRKCLMNMQAGVSHATRDEGEPYVDSRRHARRSSSPTGGGNHVAGRTGPIKSISIDS